MGGLRASQGPLLPTHGAISRSRIVLAVASVQVWPCGLYKVCREEAARSRMGAADVSGPISVPRAFCHFCVLGSESGCRRWGMGGW